MNKFDSILNEMKNLYQNDERPWVIGYSGGKDSTCVLQMTYNFLKKLPYNRRKKEIIVTSSDTLVETPYIKSRLEGVCNLIKKCVKKDKLPISVKILRPELNDTFWVNLIGRGYPSPNRWFRWCTDRLKIKPMNRYIEDKVKENGEVIILLGARKSESASRAQTMGKYEIKNFRLRRNSTVPNAFIYTPIEDLEFTDVWDYLLKNKSPWGDDNFELARLYKRVNRECPLVIDKSTPACGGSRFGCWVCTVVSRDRAIEGLIEDGEEWLRPLLDFRNWLKEIRDDPSKREPIRKSESKKQLVLDFFGKKYIPEERKGHKVLGPFTLETRHEILRRLIKLQKKFELKDILLISSEEIEAIENLWIYEGDDISSIIDILDIENISNESKEDLYYLDNLNKVCYRYSMPFSLVEGLLLAEKDFSKLSRRTGIYNRLEKILEKYAIKEIKNNI